jgi:hypothetical protein
MTISDQRIAEERSIFGDNLETRAKRRPTKSNQPETRTAGRARSRVVAMITSKRFRRDIGKLTEGRFQNFYFFPAGAFLRSENPRRAIGAEQSMIDIVGADDCRQVEFVRPFDSHKMSQLRDRRA